MFELPKKTPRRRATAGSSSRLFKTPTANLGKNGAAQHPDKRKAGGHGPTLDDEVSFLLPYSQNLRAGKENEAPTPGSIYSPESWWGDFLPTVRIWERKRRISAPAPAEVGPRGGIQVTAFFAEWLMGFDPGHVTETPGLTRAEQLHAIGNAVCKQQALAAYSKIAQEMGLDFSIQELAA